jgi:hypothetical protein
MIGNLIPSDIPIRHQRIVRKIQTGVIRHARRAPVRVLPLCQELVDGVERVRLDGVVGREDDELGDVGLFSGQERTANSDRVSKIRKTCITASMQRLTGLNPPGGLVLAQLQFGSLHWLASHEYPAACALDVGPLIWPSSWAPTPSRVIASRDNETIRCVENIFEWFFWWCIREEVLYVGRGGERS